VDCGSWAHVRLMLRARRSPMKSRPNIDSSSARTRPVPNGARASAARPIGATVVGVDLLLSIGALATVRRPSRMPWDCGQCVEQRQDDPGCAVAAAGDAQAEADRHAAHEGEQHREQHHGTDAPTPEGRGALLPGGAEERHWYDAAVQSRLDAQSLGGGIVGGGLRLRCLPRHCRAPSEEVLTPCHSLLAASPGVAHHCSPCGTCRRRRCSRSPFRCSRGPLWPAPRSQNRRGRRPPRAGSRAPGTATEVGDSYSPRCPAGMITLIPVTAEK
jgi:hypothetical protein